MQVWSGDWQRKSLQHLYPFGPTGQLRDGLEGVWSKFCLKFNTGDVETLYAAFGPPSEQDMIDKVSAMVTLHEKP